MRQSKYGHVTTAINLSAEQSQNHSKPKMAGRTFDYTLSDEETKLQLGEFEGKRRLHIRKFSGGYATQAGIWLHEREISRFLDIQFDINRAFDDRNEWVYHFNDYFTVTCYKSGTVDFRYTFRLEDGGLIYSKKKGITLKRHLVKELFDILCKEYRVDY